jgi:hypothetical protein
MRITAGTILIRFLVLMTVATTCLLALDEARPIPEDVLRAKKVYVYLQQASESVADKERLRLARDWAKSFFARPDVAARFTLEDQPEKADIVLFLYQGLEVSTVGIPSDASTVTLSDGSVIGSNCYEKSDSSLDCQTYEGRLSSASHWNLLVHQAQNFGKRYSVLPPESDPEPVPNPVATPLVRIDEHQIRVELCVHGYTAPPERQFELAIGCEVVEFWNMLGRAEKRPELSSLDVFGPAEQIRPNPAVGGKR